VADGVCFLLMLHEAAIDSEVLDDLPPQSKQTRRMEVETLD